MKLSIDFRLSFYFSAHEVNHTAPVAIRTANKGKGAKISGYSHYWVGLEIKWAVSYFHPSLPFFQKLVVPFFLTLYKTKRTLPNCLVARYSVDASMPVPLTRKIPNSFFSHEGNK